MPGQGSFTLFRGLLGYARRLFCLFVCLIMINVALCGFGYWGRNLLRVFSQHKNFAVVAVADMRAPQREVLAKIAPGVSVYESAEEAIQDGRVEAVVIATPVGSHYPLARLALEKGKHVMVEKPICATSEQAAELTALAERNGVTLMVDHTFLFHPVVRKFKELLETDTFGTISYYDSLRVNLGLFQPDVNVLWDLAPHDLSIIDYLFDEEPVHIEASGYSHVNGHLCDIAYVTLHFPSRIVAHLNLSWMSPVKVRRIAVGGSKKMVVWDDLDRDEPLRIYDSGITIQPQQYRDAIIPGYRIGDVYAPRLPSSEALIGVADHFHAVISGQEKSIMDGPKGGRMGPHARTYAKNSERKHGSRAGRLSGPKNTDCVIIRATEKGPATLSPCLSGIYCDKKRNSAA